MDALRHGGLLRVGGAQRGVVRGVRAIGGSGWTSPDRSGRRSRRRGSRARRRSAPGAGRLPAGLLPRRRSGTPASARSAPRPGAPGESAGRSSAPRARRSRPAASGSEVLVHQGIVRHEDPVHEGEIHMLVGVLPQRDGAMSTTSASGPAPTGRRRARSRTRRPASVVPMRVAHTVQAAGAWSPAHPRLRSELGEMPAHEVDDGGTGLGSSSRTTSSTTVRNTIGATGPSIAASSRARTWRASSTLRTKGIRVRSNAAPGELDQQGVAHRPLQR